MKKIPEQDSVLKWPMSGTISNVASHFEMAEKNL